MRFKKRWITLIVIIGVIILAVYLVKRNSNSVSKETTLCIANNSVIYTQLGCHACENQEEIFRNNYQYLNIVDCFYEKEKCKDIERTPTWLINGEKYIGVKTIEELKELTGCGEKQSEYKIGMPD